MLLLAACSGLLLASCEEEALPINFTKPIAAMVDTTYISATVDPAQSRIVLLEDFTGVRCPTCPNGHKAIKDILAAYPGRVAAIAIHPGKTEFPQAFPFSDEPDFNTLFGKQVMNIIGKPSGIPFGAIDRQLKSNLVTTWDGFVNQRMIIAPVANVEILSTSYLASTREFTFKIKFTFTEDVDEEVFYSTVITEDKISSKQEYTGGIYDPYEHNHILRTMPHFKVSLNPGKIPAIVKGRVYEKEFKITLEPGWVYDNLNLVVYVHKDVEILQAAEETL